MGFSVFFEMSDGPVINNTPSPGAGRIINIRPYDGPTNTADGTDRYSGQTDGLYRENSTKTIAAPGLSEVNARFANDPSKAAEINQIVNKLRIEINRSELFAGHPELAQKYVSSLVELLAHPERVNQGISLTCVSTGELEEMFRGNPAYMAKFFSSLALDGQAVMPDGKTVMRISANDLINASKPDVNGAGKSAEFFGFSQRTLVEKLYEDARGGAKNDFGISAEIEQSTGRKFVPEFIGGSNNAQIQQYLADHPELMKNMRVSMLYRQTVNGESLYHYAVYKGEDSQGNVYVHEGYDSLGNQNVKGHGPYKGYVTDPSSPFFGCAVMSKGDFLNSVRMAWIDPQSIRDQASFDLLAKRSMIDPASTQESGAPLTGFDITIPDAAPSQKPLAPKPSEESVAPAMKSSAPRFDFQASHQPAPMETVMVDPNRAASSKIRRKEDELFTPESPESGSKSVVAERVIKPKILSLGSLRTERSLAAAAAELYTDKVA